MSNNFFKEMYSQMEPEEKSVDDLYSKIEICRSEISMVHNQKKNFAFIACALGFAVFGLVLSTKKTIIPPVDLKVTSESVTSVYESTELSGDTTLKEPAYSASEDATTLPVSSSSTNASDEESISSDIQEPNTASTGGPPQTTHSFSSTTPYLQITEATASATEKPTEKLTELPTAKSTERPTKNTTEKPATEPSQSETATAPDVTTEKPTSPPDFFETGGKNSICHIYNVIVSENQKYVLAYNGLKVASFLVNTNSILDTATVGSDIHVNIYAIRGIGWSDYVAVQFEGDNNYYLFQKSSG